MTASPLQPIFAATDPAAATDSATTWVTLILRELARTQATGFILDLVKWTLLGAVLGVILAIIACVFFSRLGWYDLRMRFARGLRWTTFGLTVVLAGFFFGTVGMWQGAVRGSERVLTQSQLTTEVFPEIANALADGMAWVQVQATLTDQTNRTELDAQLEAFRTEQWELHPSRFLQELDTLTEDVITNSLARLEQSTLARTPQLKGGLGEKLLHQLIHGLGRPLITKQATSKLNRWGASQVYYAIREKLTPEAALAGNPETIKRSEISRFLIRDGIVPGIMNPIRTIARSQQIPLLAIGVLVMVLPPTCIRLARKHLTKTPTPPAIPPPIQPTTP
jgi:hypothetical protein